MRAPAIPMWRRTAGGPAASTRAVAIAASTGPIPQQRVSARATWASSRGVAATTSTAGTVDERAPPLRRGEDAPGPTGTMPLCLDPVVAYTVIEAGDHAWEERPAGGGGEPRLTADVTAAA